MMELEYVSHLLPLQKLKLDTNFGESLAFRVGKKVTTE